MLVSSLTGCICTTLAILGLVLLFFYFHKDDISLKKGMFIPRFPGFYQGESSADIYKRGRAFSIKDNKLLFTGLGCGAMSGLLLITLFIPAIWAEYFGYKNNEFYAQLMKWWTSCIVITCCLNIFFMILDRALNGQLPSRICKKTNTSAQKDIK